MYRLTETDTVVRIDDSLFIPNDPENRHRREYNEWIAAGNTPDPYVPPAPPVPQTVSSMQAKVALSRAGLLGAVQSWVDSQNDEKKLIWASATTFDRASDLVQSAASSLGLSPAQIDALFVAAAQINP